MKRPSPRILVPLALAAGVLAIVLWWAARPDANGPIEASGTVEALDADLAFRYGGTIRSVLVEEGDAVAAGDTLATRFADEEEVARDAAAAVLEAAEQRLLELRRGARPQELAQAEAAAAAAAQRLGEAREEADRARVLFAGDAISEREHDRAQTALAAAEADAVRAREQLELVREGPRTEQVAAQRALVDQARAGLAQAESTIDKAILRAPFAGVVTIRHRDPGETVPAGGPVVTIMDPADRWVRIYVREDEIGRVRVGQPTRIESDSYRGRAYEGRVTFISQEAEFTPSNVQTEEERVKLVYEVKVAIIRDPDDVLKVGTPADVTILPGEE